MTIREIESIVQTLRVRHPHLDEDMLGLLLRAGGWEESLIKDAFSIFARYERNKPTQPEKIILTPPEQERVDKNKVITMMNVVNHDDNLVVGTTELEVKLPEVSNTDLLPEVIHSDHMLEDPKKEEDQHVASVEGNTSLQGDFPKQEGVHYSLPLQSAELPKVASLDTTKIDVPVTQKTEEMVYLTPDGKVMNDAPLAPIESDAVTKKEGLVIPKTDVVEHFANEKKTATAPLRPEASHLHIQKTPEPQSLITHEVISPSKSTSPSIPENLPLRPFESSPHIIPFSKYKEDFHKEEISQSMTTADGNEGSVPYVDGAEELIRVKKTPFSKGDEGVAILAGIMLLIIMLLLGYMYGNGRL